jgi:8-oxo-dGTP diphosphatase
MMIQVAGGVKLIWCWRVVSCMNTAMDLHVDTIDWPRWQPTEEANLCFVIRDGQVLLIRKKCGLGAGKINGPGGRLEPGETAEQAAVRELQEELGITPTGLEEVGELSFQFRDGYKLHVAVFAASGCLGNPVETVEAAPIWTDLENIPYHDMWQDDPHWLPLLLARKKFRGRFVFDGDRLLSHHVEKL